MRDAPRKVVIGLAALAALLGAVALALGAFPARAQRSRCTAPRVDVDKSDGELALVCSEGRRSFPATFGAEPRGPKLREGDERTPEGTYRVTSRLRTPRFHRFLGLSYPNATDRARSRAARVTRLGGGIGIHGVRAQLAPLASLWLHSGLARQASWGPTDGCIGLTNDAIEVVFDAVRVGTTVVIRP